MNNGIIPQGMSDTPLPYGLLGRQDRIAPMPDSYWHPDAENWMVRVRQNGGQVSAPTMRAVSRFCATIESAGIRGRFYRLNLFCGASDASLNAVRTPLYRGPSLSGTQFGNTTDANVNFVQGDYAETGASGGLKGNGTTKYIDTGLAQSEIALTNVHLSAGFRDITTSFTAERTFIGAFNSGQTDFSVLRAEVSTGNLQGAIASFTAIGSANQASAATLLIASRASLTDCRLYINGSQNASSAASVGSVVASARTYFVFARNNAGSANNFNDARLRVYSIGLAIDANGAAALNSAMAAFNTAMGRT